MDWIIANAAKGAVLGLGVPIHGWEGAQPPVTVPSRDDRLARSVSRFSGWQAR